MTEEKLIDFLEKDSSREDAFFTFQYDDVHENHEYIHANRDGLKLFFFSLLRTAYEINPKRSEQLENIFHLDDSLYLHEEGIDINYVRLSDTKRSDHPLPDENDKISLVDRLIPIGCVVLLLGVIVLAIYGVVSLVN